MSFCRRDPCVALAAGLLLIGCTSTETGNPPVQPDTGLDVGSVTFQVVPNMGDPGLLSGLVDMTVAAGGEVHITAVETTLDTVRVPIAGEPPGFSASLPADFTGWLRLQVVPLDAAPLGPLDIVTGDAAGGPVDSLPSSVGPCLEISTALMLDVEGEGDVLVRNRCPMRLTFDAPVARLGGVDVVPGDGFELSSGGRRVLRVVRNGAFPTGDAELVVLREVSGERRAVTVRE